MGGPFKRSRMGPDDVEVRLLIPSKVSAHEVKTNQGGNTPKETYTI